MLLLIVIIVVFLVGYEVNQKWMANKIWEEAWGEEAQKMRESETWPIAEDIVEMRLSDGFPEEWSKDPERL